MPHDEKKTNDDKMQIRKSQKFSYTLAYYVIGFRLCGVTYVIVDLTMVGCFFHPLYANELLIDSDCDVRLCICLHLLFFLFRLRFHRSCCSLTIFRAQKTIRLNSTRAKSFDRRQCGSDMDWLRFMKYLWIHRWRQRCRQRKRHPEIRSVTQKFAYIP